MDKLMRIFFLICLTNKYIHVLNVFEVRIGVRRWMVDDCF